MSLEVDEEEAITLGIDKMEFTVNIEWVDHLAFNVRWDLPEAPDILMDEPPDLGGSGKGPNASRMVVAGVANCLGASLLFCLQKSRVEMDGFSVRATTKLGLLVEFERSKNRVYFELLRADDRWVVDIFIVDPQPVED